MDYSIDKSIIIDFPVPGYLHKTMQKADACYETDPDSFDYLHLLDALDQDVKEAYISGKISYSQAKKIFYRYGI